MNNDMEINFSNLNYFNEFNKRKIFNKNKNKKAVIAMEYLISIMLSCVALVYLVKMFYSFFLNTPTNEKIAIDNAKSIKEFIEYFSSSDKFNTLNSCFNVFKISHLKNFQTATDGNVDNFFYVIDENSIKLVKYNNFQEFNEKLENGENVNYLFYKSLKFKKKDSGDQIILNLFKDETEEKEEILNLLVETVTLGIYGLSGSKFLEIDKSKKIKYLVLVPYIGSQSVVDYGKKLVVDDFSKNVWDTYLIDNNNKMEKIGGDRIAFNVLEKFLFIPAVKKSSVFVEGMLCSNSILVDNDLNSFFLKRDPVTHQFINIDKVDYVNRKVRVLFLDSNDNEVSIYSWIGNKPKCETNKCFGDLQNIRDFKDFIKKSENILKTESDIFDIKIEIIDLTNEEIQENIENNIKVDFKDVFVEDVDENGNFQNLLCLEKNKKDVKSIKTYSNMNSQEFNGREDSVSNMFYINNNRIIFYNGKKSGKFKCNGVIQGKELNYIKTFYCDSRYKVACYDSNNFIKNGESEDQKQCSVDEKYLNKYFFSFDFNESTDVFCEKINNRNYFYLDPKTFSIIKNTSDVNYLISKHEIIDEEVEDNYYYYFNEYWLRKKVSDGKIKVYLGGKEIQEVVEYQEKYDDSLVTWIKINDSQIMGGSNKVYDILLSSTQVNNIEYLKEGGNN